MNISNLIKEPFPHSQVSTVLSKENVNYLLNWLKFNAPWQLKKASFYEQYEFSFKDTILPEKINKIISKEFISEIKEKINVLFEVNVEKNDFDLVAHKLTSGQEIKIHNDLIIGMETHRFLIQLNYGWSDDNGGILLLFNKDKSLSKAIRPINNSGFFFEISNKSYHAVTPITSGERYTLVFSFYAN